VRGSDHRERPRPQPPRLPLAEERQPSAAVAVTRPERLGGIEVAVVDLVEDFQEPRLLGLEEGQQPEGAARLALGAAEARERGSARAGPRLVPPERLLVEEDAHHLGHRERGALVGQEEGTAVGQGRAHRVRRRGRPLPQPPGVPTSGGGRRNAVGVAACPPRRAGRRLGRALGPASAAIT
jgi:hypothetical protein